VDCEWDPATAKANVAKHGVHFADAVGALEDDSALTIRDPNSEDEERWITVEWTLSAGFWWSSTPGVEREFGSFRRG